MPIGSWETRGYLVGEQQVGEYRPRVKHQLASACALVLQHVPARHIAGQEVGRELQAARLDCEQRRQALDQLGLAQAGQAFEQHVAAREAGDEHHFGQRFLAKQNLPKAIQDLLGRLTSDLNVFGREQSGGHGILIVRRSEKATHGFALRR